MTPLEMIAEWRNGCSVAGHNSVALGGDPNPAACVECTTALIDALERELRREEESRP